ncbi:hypothetical protein HXY33_01600 [Candidatus Bathyarchaeota archaeon]|nr:hypothetical protein [Candidatus Bathyarchaeota archaeon]
MPRMTAIKGLSIVLLCAMFIAIPLAKADESTESFSIYTDREEYFVGEAINIYVKANAIDVNQTITVTDIIVYNPANVSVAEWHNISIVLADTNTQAYVGTIIAESEGGYTVSAEATGCPWILRAIWRFICCFLRNKVVPEVPFGTVIPMVILLGATGLYAARKKTQRQNIKES